MIIYIIIIIIIIIIKEVISKTFTSATISAAFPLGHLMIGTVPKEKKGLNMIIMAPLLRGYRRDGHSLGKILDQSSDLQLSAEQTANAHRQADGKASA